MASEKRGSARGELTRRGALWSAGSVGAVAMAGRASAATAGRGPTPAREQSTVTTPADAVAVTRSGSVRGFKRGGVYVFKGIPYGADTGGSSRFRPPRPPQAWTGVRLSLAYGPVCPQPPQDRSMEAMAFVQDLDAGYEREDCLRANVWSPALDRGAKLPVMVWLHGGGFVSGSSQELPPYDGENLARQGVVMVSVNHRLGPLGFLDLSSFGTEYASSANVGLLDLVLALEWVRDNISSFGGDPSRVTIFGHSGGGGKVSALMAMPAAKGLFHRAVVMSGSFPLTDPRRDPRKLADGVFAGLGLAQGDLAGLTAAEPAKVIAAGFEAVRKLGPGANFGPALDPAVLPEGWESDAPRISAGVPMIIGNVRDEFRPIPIGIDEADLIDAVPPSHRAQAGPIVAEARKAFPGHPPGDLAAIIRAMGIRNLALDQARKKHALMAAPVFSYWFTWPTPVLDGQVGVPHGSDVPAAFNNTALADQFTGNGPEARRVARLMSRAWVNFATTGDPSQPDLVWPRYDPINIQTMVFDSHSRVERDPAGGLRRLLA